MTDETKHPFQVTYRELERHLDRYVDAVFETLSSFYLELPLGEHFVDYGRFQAAYEVLKEATATFQKFNAAIVREAIAANGLVLVVLRCIAGLSPPELADVASERLQVTVDQGFARSQDQQARDGIDLFAEATPLTASRLQALTEAACRVIEEGPSHKPGAVIHRLDKVDTNEGLASVHKAAVGGIQYPMLLYERMLGRPFASHRDAVSERVGDIIEEAVAGRLGEARVAHYRTRRAERIEGFDQAPDFLIPDRKAPKIVIEAKLTQDDGTARDKVTRVQHLAELGNVGKRFEVIACIDGRGFKIRREDMRKLLLATRGKVFTVATMPLMVESTRLQDFAERQAPSGD